MSAHESGVQIPAGPPTLLQVLIPKLLEAVVIVAFNFLTLLAVEAAHLVPQGWQITGVLRHVLSWGIIWELLLLQGLFTFVVLAVFGLRKELWPK